MSFRGAPRLAALIAFFMGLVGLAAPSLASARAGVPAQSLRTISYHGYRVSVPASWPVYDLARDPLTCVRFDRHAVYLGDPSPRQRCPAHVVGRTEAILLAPLAAVTADVDRDASSRASGGAPSVPGGAGVPAGGVGVPAGGSSASWVLPRAGLQVVATWGANRDELTRLLGHPLVPAPAARPARPAPMLRVGESRAQEQVPGAPYAGPGFDACSAPSAGAMSAWAASPYRAIGVYIGGPNEGCSQPNLTPAWVSTETAAGWHLIPTYVGLQGAGSGCGCSEITPTRATAEGVADAVTAVADARALGIPPGNPIYDDMEQYARSAAHSAAVLAYLEGWTDELHAEGYLSGVYSSASSGIADLVAAASTGYAEPDDIWIADWNGQESTIDPGVPSTDWPAGQRLHQYRGAHNETWGGVRINIDSDFLGGATATASAAGAMPDGTFIQVAGTPGVWVIAGGAPLYVEDLSDFASPPAAVQQISQEQWDALPAVPADGTFLTTTSGAAYRMAGGAPLPVSDWSLYGGEQPSVEVDAWDLANLGNPLVHLRSAPADGTVVEGLPSGSFWSFVGGARTPAAPLSTAVQVPDSSLAPFPVVECVAPRLRHMTLVRARRALLAAKCGLGTVRRPHRWPRGHLLHVLGQSVAPGSVHPVGWRISLRLIQ